MTDSPTEIAKAIRLDILKCVKNTGRRGAHVGPCLSCADILAVIFGCGFNLEKDLFILSKGHAGLAYYAAMAAVGLITKEQLATFDNDGGYFPGQPSRADENGITFSSGSLGMGLSYACGRALAKNKAGESGRVFVLLGDGELDEGSVWESAAFAAQMRLGNIVAITDANGMQSDGYSKDILAIDIPAVWKAYGWDTIECNGHDCASLKDAIWASPSERPRSVIARTVKGKGVSFIENNVSWHHAALSDEQYELAIEEVRNGL